MFFYVYKCKRLVYNLIYLYIFYSRIVSFLFFFLRSYEYIAKFAIKREIIRVYVCISDIVL